jgi:FtsZ-binding cell division protein ZapB
MLTLEQVKLLEAKVANAIDYVQRVTGENAALRKKLESNQKRIDELEILMSHFKEDQNRIEDGILAALDRLNQFEDAVEKSLSGRGKESKTAPRPKGPDKAPDAEIAAEEKPARQRTNVPTPSPADGSDEDPGAKSELDIF